MNASDGSPAEMPIVPSQAEWLSPDEVTADRLLSGLGVAPDAPPDQQVLALVLESAAWPASERELAGERAAVAQFERVLRASRSHAHRARHERRPRGVPDARRIPVARRIPLLAGGGVLAVVAALGGTAAAGVLPAQLQDVAHTVFGAPAPVSGRPAPSAGPSSPQGGNGPSPTILTTLRPTQPAGNTPGASATAKPKGPHDGKADDDKAGDDRTGGDKAGGDKASATPSGSNGNENSQGNNNSASHANANSQGTSTSQADDNSQGASNSQAVSKTQAVSTSGGSNPAITTPQALADRARPAAVWPGPLFHNPLRRFARPDISRALLRISPPASSTPAPYRTTGCPDRGW